MDFFAILTSFQAAWTAITVFFDTLGQLFAFLGVGGP